MKSNNPVGVSLPVSGTTTILPDPEGLLEALSRIGYSTSEAVGDLVDNSIDAGATRIVVRVLRRDSKLFAVVIGDDGEGMSNKRMDEAMGFGVRTGKSEASLGKYGMGLKSASFSQCASLTVMSRRDGEVGGRRWTTAGVREGWKCAHIEADATERYLEREWFDGEKGAGTLIRWDELDAFRVPAARADATLADLFDSLSLNLGLTFHRFLERDLQIDLDAEDVESGDVSVPRPVRPLDPFGYKTTGHADFPRTFQVDLSSAGRLDLEAHIWPGRSRSENYLLGRGQVARRQGFYFYRNDRLIQGGGWNGLRADGEPHMSLARVRVDLSGGFDAAFGLNIQKSGVHVPDGFDQAVAASVSDGLSFADYLATAQLTYREKKPANSGGEELVVGAGVPAKVRAAIRSHVDDERDVRNISISWKVLPSDRFFEWQREQLHLYLNSHYRHAVLYGSRGSAADAPLVKALLFSRLRADLRFERLSSSRSREWDELQRVLVAAAQQQDRS